MYRTMVSVAALTTLWCVPLAHAEPDPYSEDYVSVAKPLGDWWPGGWGAADTQQNADTIALAECRRASGQDCMVIETNYRGCVAYVTGDNVWRTARADTPSVAENLASQGVAGEVSAVSYCST